MAASEPALREAFRPPMDSDFEFDVTDGLEELQEASKVADEVALTPVRNPVLHGHPTKPSRVIQKENAWHRQAAYLIAQGMTQKQVAEALGRSQAAVQMLFKQTWFQQEVVTIIHNERIDDGAFKLLENAAAAAAMTVIQIASDAENVSPATRLKASETILSRVLGPIGREKIQQSEGSAESLDEIEALSEQINNIKKQLTIL